MLVETALFSTRMILLQDSGYSKQTAALSQFLYLIYSPCMNSLVAQKQNEKEMGRGGKL